MSHLFSPASPPRANLRDLNLTTIVSAKLSGVPNPAQEEQRILSDLDTLMAYNELRKMPAKSSGKTTITAPVVLPASMTGTLNSVNKIRTESNHGT